MQHLALFQGVLWCEVMEKISSFMKYQLCQQDCIKRFHSSFFLSPPPLPTHFLILFFILSSILPHRTLDKRYFKLMPFNVRLKASWFLSTFQHWAAGSMLFHAPKIPFFSTKSIWIICSSNAAEIRCSSDFRFVFGNATLRCANFCTRWKQQLRVLTLRCLRFTPFLTADDDL